MNKFKILIKNVFWRRVTNRNSWSEKQPDEQESSSSDESSTDSTSELLRRIDLNAENVETEDDSLVDAIALNETADQNINTENNEAVIHMVVQKSTFLT